VIAYDDAICYGTQSLKLNDYTTTRVHHTTMIQMLNKLRKLWLKLNCPFKINKTMDDQVKFLRNLPSITKVALPADKQTWKQAKEFYKNYLHPTMLDVESWEVFNKMCEAYEKGWTFYGKGSKEEEQKGKKRKAMSIGWLKPLQGTSNEDLQFLCKAASVEGPHEEQLLYFDGHSRGAKNSIPDTLASMAHLAKQRVGLQNALRWLHVNDGNRCSRVGWLTQDVMQYGNREVLNALVKGGSQAFYDKWSFIPSNTGFDTMRAYEPLIPVNLLKHFNGVKQGGCGLYNSNGHFIQGEGLGMWSMEFHHVGSRGLGIDTKVKVTNSIFEVQDGVKMARNTCWMFECRGHGSSTV
jgi:hypothetical protein